MSPLRGHAYFLEFAGRRSGGPWLWLVAAVAVGLTVIEAVSRVR